MQQKKPLSQNIAQAMIRLADLKDAYQTLRQRFQRAGRERPNPARLWADHEFDPAHQTCTLRSDDWASFPVVLEGVRQSDQLMVYFRVHPFPNSDTYVLTRIKAMDLHDIAATLRDGAHTDVSEWNLLHVNMALDFANLVPAKSRFGVPESVITAIETATREGFQHMLEGIPSLRPTVR